MKTIILCTLCLASFAVVRAIDQKLITCLQDAGSTIADIPALLSDSSNEGLRRRGCIEACIMQKAGLMNGNAIDFERLDETINRVVPNNQNREQLRQSVYGCAENAANNDECVVAQHFASCGLQHLRLGIRQIIDGLSL